MKKVLLFVFCWALSWVSSIAQPQNVIRCSTMEVLERLEKEDPDMPGRMQEIEKFTQEFISNLKQNRVTSAVVTIPVVVHVVYNTSAQNVSDAQINSQIDVLNEDFRRLNADKVNTPSAFASVAADAQINFCLATKDPQGNATTGIIRKSTSTIAFTTNDDVKFNSKGGSDAWPAGSYLNIWVCNLSGNVIGYAQFPGGPANTDGVVVHYTAFGRTGTATSPYNKGRTGTHEVGHWLNLRHIWGDAPCGNDQVSDTPTQLTSNWGCPSYPHSTCLNSSDMFMNYMDYSDDACSNMFTQGQSTRMNALFASGGFRVSLKTSQGCGGCAAPGSLSASSITSTSATLNWSSTGASSYNVNYRVSGAGTWTSTTSTTNSKGISGLSASTTYEYRIQSVCGSSTSSWSSVSTFATSSTGCATPASLSASSITTNSATLNWSGTGASSYNVNYRASGTTTWTSTTSTTNSKAISGLTASTTYEYRIQSDCGSSTSSWSSVSTFTTVSSCNAPGSLSASGITSSSATLSWSSTSASSYNVDYRENGTTSWISTTSGTNSVSVSGLASSTTYEYRVQSVCGSVTSGWSSVSTFTTSSSGPVLTIGTGTSTMGQAPYGTYYMDQRVQIIVTQSEMVAAGYTSANSYIKALSFNVLSATSSVMNGFTVKLAHTTASVFTTTLLGSGNFTSGTGTTTVYTANFTPNAGWNKHSFTTPFVYNGTSNLLIEICWNNSTYSANSTVYCSTTPDYKTVYLQTDNSSGDVCGTTTGTASTKRPNIKLDIGSSFPRIGQPGAGIPETGLSVIPNPASDRFSLRFALEEASQVKVSILDITGREVRNYNFGLQERGEKNLQVNLSDGASVIENGVYICTVDINGRSYSTRLAVQK